MNVSSTMSKPQLCVLLVDDDPVLRETASIYLGLGGFSVTCVASGAEALTILEHEAFNILLLDCEMPEMNGLELLRNLRDRGYLARCAVMMVTSRDDIQAIDRAFELGAIDFTTKPVNWRLLQYEMRLALRVFNLEREVCALRGIRT